MPAGEPLRHRTCTLQEITKKYKEDRPRVDESLVPENSQYSKMHEIVLRKGVQPARAWFNLMNINLNIVCVVDNEYQVIHGVYNFYLQTSGGLGIYFELQEVVTKSGWPGTR